MMRFEWNALRPGDSVLVHDSRTPDLRLTRGTVAIVETNRGSTNSVAVRFENDTRAVTMRPRRMWVHLDEEDAPDYCWRCAAIDAAAAA